MTAIAVFRVDASIEIGAGHIMRCLTLADGLKKRGYTCSFVVSPSTIKVLRLLKKIEHQVIELSENSQKENSQEIIKKQWPNGCDLLVVDHYQLDIDYEIHFDKWAKTILVIDDLASRKHTADILLDQNMRVSGNDYDGLINKNCRVLIGPEYALLRPQFCLMRQDLNKTDSVSGLNRILVSLGATDPKGLSVAISKNILQILDKVSVDVVISSTSPQYEELKKLHDVYKNRLNLKVDVNDMASLIYNADLSIGAPGVTAWERCSLGLPTLLLVTAENQRINVKPLCDVGAAIDIGDWKNINWQLLEKTLQEFHINPSLLNDMRQSALNVCDANGVDRVINEVESFR